MKNRRLTKILSIIAATAMIVKSAITVSFAHTDESFNIEQRQVGNAKNWMLGLSDSITINNVTMPDSHDTMELWSNMTLRDNTATQSMTLTQQLNSGIRALDIRPAYSLKNSSMEIQHDRFKTGFTFENVLKDTVNFLKENRSEFIVMRISQEYTEVEAQTLENQVLKEIHKNPEYSKYFVNYLNSSKSLKDITVKEARGKIIVLDKFTSNYKGKLGVEYGSLTSIQDQYELSSNWDMYDKWTAIKNHINAANTRTDYNYTYINYLTGNYGSMPYFVASAHMTPRNNGSRLWTGLLNWRNKDKYKDFPRMSGGGIYFEGMNTLTRDYLKNNNIKYAGVIYTDFPGKDIIDTIIDVNKRNSKNNIAGVRSFVGESVVIPDGYYTYKNKNSGLVLDVTNGSKNRGVQLQQWESNGTASQKFYIKNTANGVTIRSLQSNLVMDVNGNKSDDNTAIQQYTANNTLAQNFKILRNGDGTFSIETTHGKWLDVSGGSKSKGGKVVQYSAHFGDNQKWELTYLGSDLRK